LDRAVGVPNARADRPHIRVCVEPGSESAARLGLEHAVGVQEEKVARRGCLRAPVDAGREAVVAGNTVELRRRKPLMQEICVGGYAVVVDDDHRRTLARRINRRQAAMKFVVTLVVNDDDRDVGHWSSS
jgi:hypothetical protein